METKQAKDQMRSRNLDLKGGLTLDQKTFRVDEMIYDEPFMNISFIAATEIMDENDRIEIGQAAFNKVLEIIDRKNASPEDTD